MQLIFKNNILYKTFLLIAVFMVVVLLIPAMSSAMTPDFTIEVKPAEYYGDPAREGFVSDDEVDVYIDINLKDVNILSNGQASVPSSGGRFVLITVPYQEGSGSNMTFHNSNIDNYRSKIVLVKKGTDSNLLSEDNCILLRQISSRNVFF